MKIGIVGSGMVGATAAYAMVMRGIGRDIVLVDRDEKRAQAEAYDISHAVPFSEPLNVRRGGYGDLKGSRVVIISAGVSQKEGETRLDLLKRNAGVFRQVIPATLEHAPEAVMVVATNPLDIMTYMAAHIASERGVAPSRVLGTGTMLDTARFRTLVGEHIGVDPHHVHAYVLGEHGDSEVLAWSLVRVGAAPLEGFCMRRGIPLDERIKQDIDNRVRNAAYAIIEGKGATYYGIGCALSKLVDVVLHDQRSVLTVSTPDPEGIEKRDVALSLPHLVGGDGVLAPIPLTLNAEEEEALAKSAQVIVEALSELI